MKHLALLLALLSTPSLASQAPASGPAPLAPDGDDDPAPIEITTRPTALFPFGFVPVPSPALASQDPVPEEPDVEEAGDEAGGAQGADQAAAEPNPAEEAWKAIVAATTVPGEREPIRAFDLRVEVLARQGVQTNDLQNVSYRYLAPNLIRFGIGPNRETGRGPGSGQSAYWVKDGERITQLVGRDYQPDRDLVRRMTTIAQNVIALSDPANLTLTDLELRTMAPEFLPTKLRSRGKRLDWVEFKSPDFDLYRDEPSMVIPIVNADGTISEPPPRMFRVLVGADRKSHLPVLIVLREEGKPGEAGEPLLFELKNLHPVNGFVLPHVIFVRGLEPGVVPARFQENAAQEIGIVTANLAPEFKPEDFQP